MKTPLKIALCSLGILMGAFFLIFGSFLPVLKAQAYIDAVQASGSVRTVQDFEASFGKAFDSYSPIGGEEVSKFFLSNVLGVVQSQQNIPEEVVRELIKYSEPKIYPDTRHYLNLANLYTVTLFKFRKAEDYDKAVSYYKKAMGNGPKLPPVLYGLFTLYQAKSDAQNLEEIGQTILKYWPQDTRVSDILKTLP